MMCVEVVRGELGLIARECQNFDETNFTILEIQQFPCVDAVLASMHVPTGR
jgi:hypothetical protein